MKIKNKRLWLKIGSAAALLFSYKAIIGTTIISLGGDCTTASILRKLGMRKSAYPFDWMYSSSQAICQAIEEDFSHFLAPNTLHLSDNKHMIIDYYGFCFVHDFPTIHHDAALTDKDSRETTFIRDDWRNFIDQISNKYKRRIDRLKLAFQSNDQIFLIRYDGRLDQDWATKLKTTLITKYPYSNFTIICLSSPQIWLDQTGLIREINWNLKRIRAFLIPPPTAGQNFWAGCKELFNTLGINLESEKNCSNILDDDEAFYCSCLN